MSDAREKLLKAYYENMLSSETSPVYKGEVDEINHWNLLVEAGEKKSLHKIFGCQMGLFRYTYKDSPAVMMIFQIPISSNTGNKHIADRVMEIIENVEECFTTVDYSNSKEQKLDKFIYVTIIKIIAKGDEDNDRCSC